MKPVLCVLFAFLATIEFSYGEPERFFREDYFFKDSLASFYKFHTVKSEWDAAKVNCEREGAQLFYAKDEIELETILGVANKTFDYGYLHVGIASPLVPGVFMTVDDLPLDTIYNVWHRNEPNNVGGNENCVCLAKDGTLYDVDCKRKFSYICKKTLSSLEWNAQCHMPDLEYEYSEAESKCYKFHSEPETWADAYRICSSEQSYLAIVNSESEANFLKELIEKSPKEENVTQAVFIGFHKLKSKKWITVRRKTPLTQVGYNVWGDKQPDCKYAKCGSLFFNAKLNDINCAEKTYFICEHDIVTRSSALDYRFGDETDENVDDLFSDDNAAIVFRD